MENIENMYSAMALRMKARARKERLKRNCRVLWLAFCGTALFILFYCSLVITFLWRKQDVFINW